MNFREFFNEVEGVDPYPYQVRLASDSLPDLLEIPTGLGKTAAVIVSWLFRILNRDDGTPRRLVYCLPMRVLVEQTRDCAERWVANASQEFIRSGIEPPAVHVLMGGEAAASFDLYPENHAIIIGTQDMLLSRALNRGYGMSRYRWPSHFGLLNNDCLWVVDEVQLMGSGLATTTQLQAFRNALGVLKETRTLWMSATANPDWFKSVDFDPETLFQGIHRLSPDDEKQGAVSRRRCARKTLSKSNFTLDQPTLIAGEILERHQSGHRTLVVVNTVDRAVKLIDALKKRKPSAETVLIHSRFRPADRRRVVERMLADPGKFGSIVVSTQVVEAGIDVSSRVLFTEVAPWASLVQRFGRCNRAGELEAADVCWIDAPGEIDKFAPPYDPEEMAQSRQSLSELKDVGVSLLPTVPMAMKQGHVLRRKDLIELFDTTPDLSGHDVDVSRFIRESSDLDVQMFWRDIGEGDPTPAEPAPSFEELCSVPVGDVRSLIEDLRNGRQVWKWNSLDGGWERIRRRDSVYPGLTLLLNSGAGCYTDFGGWDMKAKAWVNPIERSAREDDGQYDSDRYSEADWKDVATHTEEVVGVLTHLLEKGEVDQRFKPDLTNAGLWHDAGKAHQAFQAKIRPERLATISVAPVAKAPKDAWKPESGSMDAIEPDDRRRHFRHELASALLAMSHGQSDLVAYLVAAHHGKVRLSIRSLANERKAPVGRRFARGVWEGDVVGSFHLGLGVVTEETVIDLGLMELGLSLDGRAGSWMERMLSLRDDPGLGPFRLAMLEALLKAADERASGGVA